MKGPQAKLVGAALLAATLLGGVRFASDTASRASAAPPAAAPAKAAPAFTAELENGVSVELLGLIRGKMVKTWWLPDGTPDDHPILAKARFDRTKVIHAPENKDPALPPASSSGST